MRAPRFISSLHISGKGLIGGTLPFHILRVVYVKQYLRVVVTSNLFCSTDEHSEYLKVLRVNVCLFMGDSLFIPSTCDVHTCVSGEPPSSRKVEMEESKGGTEVVRKNSHPGKEAAEILRAFPLLDFMASSLLVRSKK